MMLIFFFGLGIAAIIAAASRNAWQLAAALTLLGAFSSIYHPVGIPMLVRHAEKPGATIGVNGLAGNLGIALAALVTGALVKWLGWRAAFAIPGLVSIGCGIAFARVAPPEAEAPAARTHKAAVALPRPLLVRVFAVMTATAVTGSLLFNFSTNGNGQLLRERFVDIVEDPAALGLLLAGVYTLASFAQLVVGRLIDRQPLKRLYVGIVLLQAPLLVLAASAHGWMLLALLTAFMAVIFGAIPFTDAMIVRYVDDRMRSRVSGMRLAVSFGISSLAVWLLGPAVKVAGFQTLLLAMAGIALVTAAAATLLPGEQATRVATGGLAEGPSAR